MSRMAMEFAELGHSVQVLTLCAKAGGDSFKPFHVFKVKRGGSVLLRNVRMLRAALRMARKADVVYGTGSPWDSWLVSLLAAKLSRKRVVVKVVGDSVWERAQRKGTSHLLMEEFNGQRGRADNEILKGFRNLLARFVDLFITPSEFLKGMVREWGVQDHKIRVIYNAVGETPGGGREKGENSGPIVTVARLVPWKGVDGLIRAIRALPETVKLVVIGDGPSMPSLIRQVRKGNLERRVAFTGRIAKEDVFRWLGRASVFVLNSRYEGLPHTVLEAMAAGVPVVATAAGGNREIIDDGKNGFLVPVGDEQVLAEKIGLLFQDESMRNRMAREALKRLKDYSWPVVVAKTEAVFRGILK